MFLGIPRKQLQHLIYLADQSAANYIIEVKRLKIAQKRIALYEKHNEHMCLEEDCSNAVVGKMIFTHCEAHLSETERRWLSKDVESKGFLEQRPLDKAFNALESDDAAAAVKRKQQLLDESYRRVDTFWARRKEQDRLLPAGLVERLRRHESELIDLDDEI